MEKHLEHKNREPPKVQQLKPRSSVRHKSERETIATQHATERNLAISKQHPNHHD
jgi:hypothetical protein